MAIGLGGFSPAPACLASFRARGENDGDADGRPIGAAPRRSAAAPEPAIAGGEAVVANVRRHAEAARLLGVPVVATEQNPAGLGGTIPAFAALPARRLEKRFFDATREADFESFLPAGRPAIVVAGCEAHVCVMQTVLGLLDRGRAVSLVADAVGSRSP